MRSIVVTPFLGRAVEGVVNATGSEPLAIFSNSDNYQFEKTVQQLHPSVPFEFTDTPRGEYAWRNPPATYLRPDLIVSGKSFMGMEAQMNAPNVFERKWDEWSAYVEEVREAILIYDPKVYMAEVPYKIFKEEDESRNQGVWDGRKHFFNVLRNLDRSVTFLLVSPQHHGIPDRSHRCFVLVWHALRCPTVPARITSGGASTLEIFSKGVDPGPIDPSLISDFKSDYFIAFAKKLWRDKWREKNTSIQDRLVEHGKLGDFAEWLVTQKPTDALDAIGEITFDVLHRNSPTDPSPRDVTYLHEFLRPRATDKIMHPTAPRFLTRREVFLLFGHASSQFELMKDDDARSSVFLDASFKSAPVTVFRDIIRFVKSVVDGECFESETDYMFWDNTRAEIVKRRKPRP